MDEKAVRAAADRLTTQLHGGLYLGTGEECRLVPVSAIYALVDAIAAEPRRDALEVAVAELSAERPADPDETDEPETDAAELPELPSGMRATT